MINNISKRQRNILLAAATVLMSVLLFFVLVYKPAQAKISSLNKDLNTITAQMTSMEELIGGRKNLGAGILRLKNEVDILDSKFIKPEDIGKLLELLSDKARRMGLDVISIHPSDFSLCTAAKGQSMQLGDKECNKINVEMVLITTYRLLSDYVQALENEQSPQLVIKKIAVEKNAASRSLRAGLVINAFAFLPKKETKKQ